MANYYGTFVTNEFKVTDEKKFKELFSRLSGEEVNLYTHKNEKTGRISFSFGGGPDVAYLVPEEDGQDGYYGLYEFAEDLQPLLDDGETFQYIEAGHEKLDVSAYGLVASKDNIEDIYLPSWLQTTSETLLLEDGKNKNEIKARGIAASLTEKIEDFLVEHGVKPAYFKSADRDLAIEDGENPECLSMFYGAEYDELINIIGESFKKLLKAAGSDAEINIDTF